MTMQKLRNPDIPPVAGILKEALGEEAYAAYQQMCAAVAERYNPDMGWKYYRDGKAWLCKFSLKGKTLFWLSVWEGFFRCSFHFTEKTRAGVAALNIDSALKRCFVEQPMTGRLVTMPVDIGKVSALANFFPLLEYKRQLK